MPKKNEKDIWTKSGQGDSVFIDGTHSEKKAVALMYDQIRAPIIKAKGEGALAWQIIEIAKNHNIYVAEDPVLAETLSYLKLEQEVPEEVYRSVATVLSWAYWLKGEVPQSVG
jgi:flagellar biosynthesis protein